MVDTNDVVIIGGGASGCAVAYYLARAGVRSTIVEVDAVASQASGFAAGQLGPLWGPPLLSPLAAQCFQMQLDLADELIQESGVDFHPRTAHLVRLALDESEVSNLETFHSERSDALKQIQGTYQFAEDMSISWLDTDEIRAREPRITGEVLAGVDTYGCVVVDPYQHTLSVFMAAEKLGASLRSGRATGLKTEGSRVTGVVLEDGEIDCDTVVVAMGPWSEEVSGWLNINVPIEPVRGELLYVDLPGPPMESDWASGGASFYPRSDGLVRIGHTREWRGFDRQPDQAVARRLLGGAVRLMPAMEEAQLVRQTVCLRPTTPDEMPMIGAAPGWDNAYMATGAGAKGILLGLGMGKATADLITEGCTDLPIESSAPERFAS